MSFCDRIQADKSGLLWFVRGKSQQASAWWLVQVNPLKLPLFKTAVKAEKIMLTDFGTIIESGFGAKPDAATLAQIDARGFKLNPEIFAA